MMPEWLALLLAFVFGLAFNAWVGRQREHSLVALWVAFGMAVLLLLAALVDDRSALRLTLHWRDWHIPLNNYAHASLYILRFCIAGGTPMIIGSLWRQLNRLMQ
ncbi:MAG: hypothetical protein N2383_03315 [Caldilineales bacterium]|nr:hypothetical protein [Caldilineales bacterium]